MSRYNRAAWLDPNLNACQRAAAFFPEVGLQGDVGDLANAFTAHASDLIDQTAALRTRVTELEAEKARYREALNDHVAYICRGGNSAWDGMELATLKAENERLREVVDEADMALASFERYADRAIVFEVDAGARELKRQIGTKFAAYREVRAALSQEKEQSDG